MTPLVACVEIGGSSVQTVVFTGDHHRFADGVDVPAGALVGVAVPGHIDGQGRIATASTFGWTDVDPVDALALPTTPAVVCNDAAAAALGEWVLRGGHDSRVVFVGVGTGIGGAVVADGAIVRENLFGHQPGFGARTCACGRIGCLETVAAGWALPRPVDERALGQAAAAIAAAVRNEPVAADGVIVVAGGLAERYPGLAERIAAALPGRTVTGSSRPTGAKSAAAWGLRRLLGAAAEHPVELRVFPDPAAVAVAAADIVQNAVATRPSLRFGVATGSSPMATYAELGRRGIDWTAASIWLLDEYVGLDPSDPNSYKCTIQRTLGDHLGIRPDQVHAPDTSSADLEAAARGYDAAIDAAGGIDLQILGIGRNGHIGFNEPGSSFAALTSVVDLTATTRDDNARFFASPDDVPRRAITQGIGRILRARRLLVIVTGAAKAPALAAALDGPIDEAVPASALRRHPAVTVLADAAAVARR